MNKDIALAIIEWYADHDVPEEETDNYEAVTDEEVYEQGRWITYRKQVFRDKRDNTFWEISWGRGSTELQDLDDTHDSLEVYRVFPYRKVVTEYATTLADAQRADANFQDEILGIVGL